MKAVLRNSFLGVPQHSGERKKDEIGNIFTGVYEFIDKERKPFYRIHEPKTKRPGKEIFTTWHSSMQVRFLREGGEKVLHEFPYTHKDMKAKGGYRQADIMYDNKTVIELQHSSIKEKDLSERIHDATLQHNNIWIFDFESHVRQFKWNYYTQSVESLFDWGPNIKRQAAIFLKRLENARTTEEQISISREMKRWREENELNYKLWRDPNDDTQIHMKFRSALEGARNFPKLDPSLERSDWLDRHEWLDEEDQKKYLHLFLARKPVWATRAFKNINKYYQTRDVSRRYNHSVFQENYAGKRVQIWLHDSTYDIFYKLICELPIWYAETFKHRYEFKGYTWKEFYEEVTK